MRTTPRLRGRRTDVRNSSTADSKARRVRRLVTLCAVAYAAQFAAAAVPVVESQPVITTSRSGNTANQAPVARSYGTDSAQVAANDDRTSAPPSASVGNASATSMFQQFQQMESDVAELRGIVEEQSHLIEKLQSEQKEQYLDLDRRLTLLMKGQPGAGPVTSGGMTGPAVMPSDGGGATATTAPPTNSTSTSPTASPTMAPISERGAYEAAFASDEEQTFHRRDRCIQSDAGDVSER